MKNCKQCNLELEKFCSRIEEKVLGIDKRLSNEETISRTAVGAVVGGTVLAVVRFLLQAC